MLWADKLLLDTAKQNARLNANTDVNREMDIDPFLILGKLAEMGANQLGP
jgi:hypothetical protein